LPAQINPVRPGFLFEGWFDINGVQWVSNETISNNMTLIASWSATEYSITYELNGGANAASNPATYTVLNTPLTLAEPTRTGHTFVGWLPGNTIATGTTGDLTFTATWEEISAINAKVISYNKNLQDKNNQNLVFTVEVTTTDGTKHIINHAEKVNGQQKGSKTFKYDTPYGSYNVNVAWNDNNTVTVCEIRD